MARRSIDSRIDFLSPLNLVPGLGPKRCAALAEADIRTVGDLLYYFPRRYFDRSIIVPISSLAQYENRTCTVIGTVSRCRMEKGRTQRLRAQITDQSGTLELLWFSGTSYIAKTLSPDDRILATGKITRFGGLQMVHPQLEHLASDAKASTRPFMPVYPLTGPLRDSGLQHKSILAAVEWLLGHVRHFPRILPQHIEDKKKFPPLEECLRQVHIPDHPARLAAYRDRIIYEELYQLAITLRLSRQKFGLPGRSMDPGDLPGRVEAALPFSLTSEQRKAMKILFADALSGQRMHRLLQGDVGCGKTVVAFCATLSALNAGLQVAWLTPTEVLAQQTYMIVSKWLSAFGMSAQLLTGATPAAQKKLLATELGNGSCRFVVSTHALLQPQFTFSGLGMIVIDEQHKFGAAQRLALAQKDMRSDLLLMSATPIPQTLAKTIYDDLDIVTIEKPPRGRKPVKTRVVPDAKRNAMETFVKRAIIDDNARVFYIAPRIESDDESTVSVEGLFDRITHGAFAGLKVAILHGRLDRDQKMAAAAGFSQGTISLLCSTTVVEVGIDVPEASIIIIENAERFGLAQLHQLRGRVGRGGQDAWCFLLHSPDADGSSVDRLTRFCSLHDGFAIAEMDLQLRGPGEVSGFAQSGWEDLQMADILQHAALFREIIQELDRIAGA